MGNATIPPNPGNKIHVIFDSGTSFMVIPENKLHDIYETLYPYGLAFAEIEGKTYIALYDEEFESLPSMTFTLKTGNGDETITVELKPEDYLRHEFSDFYLSKFAIIDMFPAD